MDYGRSVLPESPGLQARNNGKYNELQLRKEKPIFENLSKFRLRFETQPHDNVITSNRKSTAFGEYVHSPWTHCPSNQPSNT